jgi:hypothetical protein
MEDDLYLSVGRGIQTAPKASPKNDIIWYNKRKNGALK